MNLNEIANDKNDMCDVDTNKQKRDEIDDVKKISREKF